MKMPVQLAKDLSRLKQALTIVCERRIQRDAPLQTVKKPIFVSRKGSGNEAFPEWNPQNGLCPFEEKGEFQGFFKSRRNESLYTDSSSKKA